MVRLLLLAALYALVGRLTLDCLVAHFFGDPPFPLLWPSTGLGFALLALEGRRLWPAITLGALFLGVLSFDPLGGILVAVGSTLEALAALALVSRRGPIDPGLAKQRDLWRFLFGASLLPPLISAVFGGLTLVLAGGAHSLGHLLGQVVRWWLSNATGMLVMAPPLLTWIHGSRQPGGARHPRAAESALALVLALLAAGFAFGGPFDGTFLLNLAPFAPIPFIFWTALRLSPREASTVSMIFAVTASWGAARGSGPFSDAAGMAQVGSLWPYLTTLTLISLTMSVLWNEQRESERERQAGLELLEAIVDHLPALVCVRDAEARNLFVNQAMRDFYAMDDRQLLGRSIAEILGTPLGEQITEMDLRVLTHRDPMPFQEVGLDDSQRFELREPGFDTCQPRHFLTTKQVLAGEGPLRLLTIAFDITELKLAQAAHQRAEAKLRSVLENIDGWVLTVNDQGTLFFANRPFPGASFQDMVAAPLTQWFFPESRAAFDEALDRASSGRGSQALEVRADWVGHPWLECRISPVRNPGTVRELTISLLDIEARRQAAAEQTRLRDQMRRLENLDSLGSLAGGIAHDFNNLLTAVLGNAAMAATEVDEGSKPHRCLRRIEGAAERAAELCQQMLDFAGRAKTEPVPCDLSDLVHGMVEALRGALSSQVTLDLELAGDLPPVHCDPTHVRRVVMNLITNADDALDGQPGTLRIVTTCGHLTLDDLQAVQQGRRLEAGDFVRLEVHDNGCGMDRKTLRQIFDPFFTTKFSGRGLGLAAAGGTMRRHGGGILVDSAPGRGTRFTLLFPAHDGTVPDAETMDEPEPTPSTEGGLVLVADDQEVVTELARAALEEAGFSVVTARDGAAALRLLDEYADQLRAAVVDHGMPKASGIEVIRRAQQQGHGIPMMLSSGFDESQLAAELDAAPWSAFLRKPYRPDDLIRAVRRMLGQSSERPDPY